MNKLLAEFIKDKFGEQKGFALDFGSGGDCDVRSLRSMGWETTGLDLPKYDLNLPYESDREADLIYSIAVIQFINNKNIFVENIYKNLKNGGWFFVLTFSKEDVQFGKKSGMFEGELKNLFARFKNVEIKNKNFFDVDPGHNHWHKLLIIKGQKKED